MQREFFLQALIATLVLSAVVVAGTAASAAGSLNRIALAVGAEAGPVRVEFAQTAIAEMIAAHQAEAQLARREAREQGSRRDLLRWAAAVDAYAAELAAIGQSLTPDSSVGISIGADDSLYLAIAGRPVIVTTPRAQAQAEFEQRIVERFCSAYHCADFVSEFVLSAAASASRPAAAPSWSFSQSAGPACSSGGGLELQFRTLADLSRKREVCARLVAELELLLAALARQIDAGVPLDWNRLLVQGDPNAERQRVVLNGAGDTLQLPLPYLVQVPDFLHRSLPWVAAASRGQRYHLVLINADELVAPLLYP